MALTLIILAIGKLLIYLWQKFPLPKVIIRLEFIRGLHDCDLCSGVWIYTILSFMGHIDLLHEIGVVHIPLLSEAITGSILSFVMHLLVMGWKAKFEIIEL